MTAVQAHGADFFDPGSRFFRHRSRSGGGGCGCFRHGSGGGLNRFLCSGSGGFGIFFCALGDGIRIFRRSAASFRRLGSRFLRRYRCIFLRVRVGGFVVHTDTFFRLFYLKKICYPIFKREQIFSQTTRHCFSSCSAVPLLMSP